MAAEREKKEEIEGKIEVLNFRKGASGTRKNTDFKTVKHKGRKRRKEKLKEQLMKHYGLVLEDN